MGPDGWVKLYRKTQKSDMYKNLNSVQRDVMINCLMLANHKENKWEWNGEIFEAEPGQFITSLSSLKEVCAKDVSIQNIRTALKKLERWDFLTNKSTKTGRLITIVNWGKYQGLDCEVNKDNNKEVTKNQQSTNKELTTNKNDKECLKNDKNDKEVNNMSLGDEIESIYNSLSKKQNQLFQSYVDLYRQENKTNKITTGKHHRLLTELFEIYQSMEFDYGGQNYNLNHKTFENGITEIIKKDIANLNYCKKVWISEMERSKNGGEHKESSREEEKGSKSKEEFAAMFS
jgi:uncharacterized protein YvpB